MDPNAGALGLENIVMSINRSFPEFVVTPLKENADGKRLLTRRRAGGGYRVNCQAEGNENQEAATSPTLRQNTKRPKRLGGNIGDLTCSLSNSKEPPPIRFRAPVA